MMIGWFNSREATAAGAALADEFARQSAAATGRGDMAHPAERSTAIHELLQRADRALRPLRLNFFKQAKLANTFKWRLIEKGVEQDFADELTKALVLHLSQSPIPIAAPESDAATSTRPDRTQAEKLFHKANKCFLQGAYAEAAALYEEAAECDGTHAETVNNLGNCYSVLTRYDEAMQCFRQAIALKPNFADAHCNLGIMLRMSSDLGLAEASLRQALKLNPTHAEARVNLGLILMDLGRMRDARACFAKVLKAAPRHAGALVGMAQIARMEGQFDEAEKTLRRVLQFDPNAAGAWAALPSVRKMTKADSELFKGMEELLARGLHPLDEANLRFAMGKFCDDVEEFDQAFQNFKRGNELVKGAADDYDRQKRTRFIDDLMRTYTREAISTLKGASASAKPVFVIGMPRSGTSLAEQIIASHPAAHGAGEMMFWETLAVSEKDSARQIMSEPKRAEVAAACLRALESSSKTALRVIDKAPVNADYLGMIYSVFPNARVIYMQRDPIDTCLSCYFQNFFTGLNFTLDLSDLAHYYREHQRLMSHWRSVLPAEFMLDVPYEELVADQEAWTRKMLDFIGLEWDERCLDFHNSQRQVVTASAWQVRQKIYKTSVARWRNYENSSVR